MKKQKHTAKWVAIGLGILACLGLSSCLGSDGGGDGGLVVTVMDTTTVNMSFTKPIPDTGAWKFGANDSFDVAKVRNKMKDKGMDLNTVQITDVEVTFDPATLVFVTNNNGVPFYMKIATQTVLVGGSTADTIALETSKSPYLTFASAMLAFRLNQNIFANPAGMGKLLKAIQDTTVSQFRIRGELDGDGTHKMNQSGTLNVNFIVTVGGKMKP